MIENHEDNSSGQQINSLITHAHIGENCRIINCVIEGSRSHPIHIGDNCELFNCSILADNSNEPFEFCGEAVFDDQDEFTRAPTRLEGNNTFHNAVIRNSWIGLGTKGTLAQVELSNIGRHNSLRAYANITRSRTADFCTIGSEVSKSICAGAGFVSEHYSAYLSLLAPGYFPIIDHHQQFKLIGPLPNVTNIGAGTIFANFGGEPARSPQLESSTASLKGTAIVLSAFTAINSRIINLYGESMALDQLLAPTDQNHPITTLAFGCFVENKVTGRIPAFSYAGGPGPEDHKLGWVLDRKPGMVLRLVKKTRQTLLKSGGQLHLLTDLVEGSIRLELQYLRRQLDHLHTTPADDPGRAHLSYTEPQLEDALRVYESHLDGRWALDTDGNWQRPWGYDEAGRQWKPRS